MNFKVKYFQIRFKANTSIIIFIHMTRIKLSKKLTCLLFVRIESCKRSEKYDYSLRKSNIIIVNCQEYVLRYRGKTRGAKRGACWREENKTCATKIANVTDSRKTSVYVENITHTVLRMQIS